MEEGRGGEGRGGKNGGCTNLGVPNVYATRFRKHHGQRVVIVGSMFTLQIQCLLGGRDVVVYGDRRTVGGS